MVQKLSFYIRNVIAELKKVTWPNKNEIMGSTGVVIVVSIIFSLFLFVVDNILTRIIKILF